MPELSEKVYECTLAVEAHMICNLLASAGVSARVDGEYLSGAGGELPLGNTVKVRVAPAQVAEAREIIAEWERSQPPEPLAPVAPLSRRRVMAPLWFFLGALFGAVLTFVALRTPATSSTVDFDGDGVGDETYHNQGMFPTLVEYDRNADGRVDARWRFDLSGVPGHYEGDDDFDGRFEWQSTPERGQIKTATLDSNGDGRPDQVANSQHGVLNTVDVYDEGGERVVARHHYRGGWLSYAEIDADGDGRFERKVDYNRYGQTH